MTSHNQQCLSFLRSVAGSLTDEVQLIVNGEPIRYIELRFDPAANKGLGAYTLRFQGKC